MKKIAILLVFFGISIAVAMKEDTVKSDIVLTPKAEEKPNQVVVGTIAQFYTPSPCGRCRLPDIDTQNNQSTSSIGPKAGFYNQN